MELTKKVKEYLHNAIRLGKVEEARNILQLLDEQQGFQALSYRDEHGDTAIQDAARTGQTESIELLNEFVSPEDKFELLKKKDKRSVGNTGYSEIVGGVITVWSKVYDDTPLHYAVKQGNFEMFAALIHGLKPEEVKKLCSIKNYDKKTVFELAEWSRDLAEKFNNNEKAEAITQIINTIEDVLSQPAIKKPSRKSLFGRFLGKDKQKTFFVGKEVSRKQETKSKEATTAVVASEDSNNDKTTGHVVQKAQQNPDDPALNPDKRADAGLVELFGQFPTVPTKIDVSKDDVQSVGSIKEQDQEPAPEMNF